MHIASAEPLQSMSDFRPRVGRRLFALAAFILCSLACGCAALTNPVGSGIPVRDLPAELRGQTHDEESVPLNLLRRIPPDAYRLAPGDVLGIWIGIIPFLHQPNQIPPITVSQKLARPKRRKCRPRSARPFRFGMMGLYPCPWSNLSREPERP